MKRKECKDFQESSNKRDFHLRNGQKKLALRSAQTFFSSCYRFLYKRTSKRATMKRHETGSASCCQARKRHCFYFVITLCLANDSLTRVNVKFVLLRWLNLWSVLLDGMYGVVARWHLQVIYDQIKISVRSQSLSAVRQCYRGKTMTMLSVLGQWLIDSLWTVMWKSNIARRKFYVHSHTMTHPDTHVEQVQ